MNIEELIAERERRVPLGDGVDCVITETDDGRIELCKDSNGQAAPIWFTIPVSARLAVAAALIGTPDAETVERVAETLRTFFDSWPGTDSDFAVAFRTKLARAAIAALLDAPKP